jgi:hypothetical protein
MRVAPILYFASLSHAGQNNFARAAVLLLAASAINMPLGGAHGGFAHSA